MHADVEHQVLRDPDAQLEAIAALADDCRADTLAAEARRHRVQGVTSRVVPLCQRLRHHLFEHQRALARTRQQNLARRKAVTISRSVAEQQLDVFARAHDGVRAGLVRMFTTERTKFIMASKADAMLELDLALAGATRRDVRTEAARASTAITSSLLAGLFTRLVPFVRGPVVAFATRICEDLDSSLVELGEGLQPDALVDLQQTPIGSFADEIRWRPELGTSLSDLLISRKRSEAAAHAELGDLLAQGCHAVVTRLLEYYDGALAATDARFRDRMDSIELTLMRAEQFAFDARRSDETLARNRLVRWTTELAQITPL